MAYRMTGPLAQTLARVEAWARFGMSSTFAQLRNTVYEIAEKGYKSRAQRGITVQDTTMTPLRSKRRGKYAGATGPPRSPFGASSRAVLNYQQRWARDGASNWVLEMGVVDGKAGAVKQAIGNLARRIGRAFGRRRKSDPAYSQIFKWQEDGAGRNPDGRNLLGLSPSEKRQVAAANQAALREFGGRL